MLSFAANWIQDQNVRFIKYWTDKRGLCLKSDETLFRSQIHQNVNLACDQQIVLALTPSKVTAIWLTCHLASQMVRLPLLIVNRMLVLSSQNKWPGRINAIYCPVLSIIMVRLKSNVITKLSISGIES